MAESAIPVDLWNPGQVFACLGIVEAADVLLGDAAGVFEWSTGRFRVTANGVDAPVERVLRVSRGSGARHAGASPFSQPRAVEEVLGRRTGRG